MIDRPWVRHAAAALACIGMATAQDSTRSDRPVPVPFHRVELIDSFWRPRLELQRRVLVPFAFEKTKPAVAYLEAAARHLAGDTPQELPPPHRYRSSDLYKVMEGAAYLLALQPDPALEARMDRIAKIIAGAQREDGYLYCAHVLGHGSAEHMTGDGPYQYVVHSHELYNLGHLYEAAVAYYRATGKRELLDVAIKSARHVHRVFFEGDPAYNDGEPVRQAPGHQEIELALVKLAEVTGEELFLEMARRFLEIRGVTYRPEGTGVMAPTYAQQHAPVAEQREAVGHAVRAAYMYSAMADVDAMGGRQDFVAALDAIWRDIVDTRMHITGGLGAVHGIEGFGPHHVLPNADAYNETCAAVGNVMFNWRMFLLHRDARHLDVAEVALFNNVLAGVALSGDRFFYVNPLEADGEHGFNHGRPERSPWFGTACCPTNLARLVPQVGGMLYATDPDGLWVTLYAGSATTVDFGGVAVRVEQHTDYPFDGRVRLVLSPERPVQFTLRLRIPTWTGRQFVPGALYRYADEADGAVRLRIDGEAVDVSTAAGFAVVDREWSDPTTVALELPMPVRINTCDPRVAANRGRVAITRGPLVMVAEDADHEVPVRRVFFDGRPDAGVAEVARREIAHGHETVAVTLPAQAAPAGDGATSAVPLTLVPYYAWNNRGVGGMVTWIPTSADLLPRPDAGLVEAVAAIEASHTWQGDREAAICDGKLPSSSADTSIPRWTSWPQRGKPQQIEIRLDRERPLRSVGVYWYDDGGGVQVPESWSLQVETQGTWRPLDLYVTDAYGLHQDQLNVVHPGSDCRCTAIRIHVEPRDDAAAGLLEAELRFDDG